MANWNNGKHDPWEVPPYLRNVYAVWSLIGQALESTTSAHVGAHMAEDGYYSPKDKEELPPDTLITAMFQHGVDEDELAKWQLEEEYVSLHDALTTAVAALQMSLIGVVHYIKDLGALPPWWQEEFDALTNLPDLWEEDEQDG